MQFITKVNYDKIKANLYFRLMLERWLKQTIKEPYGYIFKVYEIKEESSSLDEIKNYLGAQTLSSYKSPNYFKKIYKDKPKDALLEYIQAYVFPNVVEELPDHQLRKNTKQGDFGEILSTEIIKEFRDLEVPLYKFRWKFNSDRSLFCTDIFAHNKGNDITDLKYYEVKTKTTYHKQIGTEACKSLEKDMPTDAIADFLSKEALATAEKLELRANESNNTELQKEAEFYYDKVLKYGDIVANPKKYNKSFEIILIIEKEKYKEDILEALNSLPPKALPLEVTVVLISNLSSLVDDAFQRASDYAVKITYG